MPLWADAAVTQIRETIEAMESKGYSGTELREPIRFGP